MRSGAGGVGTPRSASRASSSATDCGSGRLVDAVERLAPAAGEQLGDELVREDHQLLDQHVRVRLRLAPRALDPALAVEGEDDLRALDPQRAAREAPVAQLCASRSARRSASVSSGVGPLAAGEDRLGLAVGQPRVAADHRAVEGRLAAGVSGISTVTQSRSTFGRSEQSSSESSGGSIGETRPGT